MFFVFFVIFWSFLNVCSTHSCSGKSSNVQFLSEEDIYRHFVCPQSSQNFKKDLVCQTCGVRGHSSKVCNEAIRAAVKNTGNKPFPNYSVEIAEMSSEEVEDMRIRLPLVVNDLCAEVCMTQGQHIHIATRCGCGQGSMG